jgi:SAM-dependent methyltransferase
MQTASDGGRNSMTNENSQALTAALWRIYQRRERPEAWADGGNLPWNEPEFSARMLREHLDESHGAASRTARERALQIDWLWAKLGLASGMNVLDITCGPGLYAVELARRGCTVTGIDFSPASIAYARALAEREQVADRSAWIEQDVRAAEFGRGAYDAALFLYGQLGVFRQAEAQALLVKCAQALKPGGRLAVELLDQERIDKKENTWWYTDDRGLWGDAPYLHLGERFWDAEAQLSIERFTILHLKTGKLDEVILCDQSYAIPTMTAMLEQAGFAAVDSYPAWAGVPLHDAQEWVVYLATTLVK